MKKELERLTVYAHGGLGDIILQYYTNINCTKAYAQKQRHPNTTIIRAYVSSQNPAAIHWFARAPWIDEVVSHPFTEDPSRMIEAIEKTHKYGWAWPTSLDTSPAKPMPPVTTESMAPHLMKMTNNRPFLTVQNFSSAPEFNLPLEALRLKLAAQASGWDVYFLGGDREEILFDGENQILQIPAVDQALLTAEADCHIGPLSCYAWSALCSGAPTVCYRPHMEGDQHAPIALSFGASIYRIPEIANLYDRLPTIIDIARAASRSSRALPFA